MKLTTSQCQLEADRMGVIARDLNDISERADNADDKGKLIMAARELQRSANFVARLGAALSGVPIMTRTPAPLFGKVPLWKMAGYCCEGAYDRACAEVG